MKAKESGRVKCVYCGKEYILFDDGTSYDTWGEDDELSTENKDEPVCRRCLDKYLSPLRSNIYKGKRR